MLLKSIALLAAALSSVQGFSGFSIPDDHPEGVYSVYFDANGTEVHTKLADPANPSSFHDHPVPTSIVALISTSGVGALSSM